MPEEKIRARYHRIWPLVVRAAEMADSAHFWDNALFDGPHQAASLIAGLAVGRPDWPSWTRERPSLSAGRLRPDASSRASGHQPCW